MAPTTLLVIALAFAFSIKGTLGSTVMNCKDLNVDTCAYAVESSGRRCVLEKPLLSIVSNSEYKCATSNIVADKLSDWIETEECINACGVNRKALGISSGSLLDSAFVGKLCSNECYRNCPNIVDLYFNLAAGEGVYLPKFCEARKSNGRRGMMEFQSSGESELDAVAPAIQRAFAPDAAMMEFQSSGESKLDALPPAIQRAFAPDAADPPDDCPYPNPWDCLPPSPYPYDSPAPSPSFSTKRLG